MIETIPLVLFAFAANTGLGAALVWLAYRGLESSGGRAGMYTFGLGGSIIAGNWFVGELIQFASWSQFEMVVLAATIGSFVGIGSALLVWEPDHSRTIPPVESEKEELDEVMENRTPAQTGGGD